MKIDVTQSLKQLNGDDIRVPKSRTADLELCAECSKKLLESNEPFTFRMLCTRALTVITEETQKMTPEKKFERGQLAAKIYNSDEPDLSVDELKELKDAIGASEGPLLLYQAFSIIDPPAE